MVFDAGTGAELTRVEHGVWLRPRLQSYSACYSPDGQRVAGAVVDDGSDQILIRVYDLSTQKELARIAAYPGLNGAPWFSPDGGTIAAVSFTPERFVGLWDVNTGELRRRLPLDSHNLVFARWSPIGDILAIGVNDQYVRLQDFASGEEIRRLEHWPPERARVECAAFSPDGTLLVSSSDKDTVIWEVATGKVVQRIDSISSAISIAFSHDGSRVATGGSGVRVWDVVDGYVVFEDRNGPSRIGGFSPFGELVGADSRYAFIIYDDVGNGPRRIRHEEGPVRTAVFSPDGQQVLTASATGIRVWETAPWRGIDPARFAAGLAVKQLSPNDRARAGLPVEPSGPDPFG